MDQQNLPGRQGASPLNMFSPMQVFGFGIVAGFLVLCTIGFFILLGIFLKGGKLSAVDNTYAAPVAAGNPTPADNQAPPVGNVPEINTKEDHILGAKNPKVTIVEYSDFECPYCGNFYPTIKQIMDKYGKDVRLVYRHYPLSFHPQAEPTALASECASEQGKFWEFHDMMFEGQTQLSDSFRTSAAQKLGLNMTKFNDCVSSKKYLDKVSAQMLGGNEAGVQGTPHSIVIGPNGEKVPISGAQPYASVEAVVKQFLN